MANKKQRYRLPVSKRTNDPMKQPLPFFTILTITCALLGGCGTYDSGVTYEEASYATVFLGPDGRAVADPRAPKPDPRKKKKTRRREAASPTAHRLAPQWHWEGDGVVGAPSIRIDLTRQEAAFYKGGKLVGLGPVSTGREGYRTPAGNFRISQKNPTHVSNLYGDFVDAEGKVVVANVGVHKDRRPAGTRFRGAPMPYFMRVHGAVGMHAGYLPGYAASHGCIRLPMEMAQTYFNHAPSGTPVTIQY